MAFQRGFKSKTRRFVDLQRGAFRVRTVQRFWGRRGVGSSLLEYAIGLREEVRNSAWKPVYVGLTWLRVQRGTAFSAVLSRGTVCSGLHFQGPFRQT